MAHGMLHGGSWRPTRPSPGAPDPQGSLSLSLSLESDANPNDSLPPPGTDTGPPLLSSLTKYEHSQPKFSTAIFVGSMGQAVFKRTGGEDDLARALSPQAESLRIENLVSIEIESLVSTRSTTSLWRNSTSPSHHCPHRLTGLLASLPASPVYPPQRGHRDLSKMLIRGASLSLKSTTGFPFQLESSPQHGP